MYHLAMHEPRPILSTPEIGVMKNNNQNNVFSICDKKKIRKQMSREKRTCWMTRTKYDGTLLHK